MSIAIESKPNRKLNFIDRLQSAWGYNKPLFLIGVFSIGLLMATSVGLIFDSRTVIGEPVWIKPTKFAISTIFYSFTFLWLLTYIKGRPRLVSWISWITAIAFFFELVLISLQAARGVRSHFNNLTAFDAAVFGIMGLMVFVLWVASLVAVILLVLQKFENRAWAWTLRLSLIISVIGAGLGFLMTMPTATQLSAAQETGTMLEVGAHSVGVADGGEGLPFLGWSTEGGDLRIGHFIGMHAMQVLPIIGIAVIAWRREQERQQLGLIWTAGLGYLAVVALVTWQALRGEPLIYPSTLTLIVAGVIAAGVALGAGISLRLKE